MIKNYKKGFTLIELLVVIAIIGILSAVVLTSLNTARTKGKDAAVKADVQGLRTAAEIYYDTYKGYATTDLTTGSCAAVATNFFGDAGTGQPYITGIAAQGGTSSVCNATAAAFSFSVKLPSGGFFCVDSTGKIGSTATVAGNLVCS
jgi:prepilin-type N-terminal cleavage/methylation domain-containing protein